MGLCAGEMRVSACGVSGAWLAAVRWIVADVAAGETRAGEVGRGAVTVVDRLAVGSVSDAQRQLVAVADQFPQVDAYTLSGSRGEARVARDRRLPDLADHQWVPTPAVAMSPADEVPAAVGDVDPPVC